MKRKLIQLNKLSLQVPLLRTKLQMPHTLTGMVNRPRLHACLDSGLQGKLILVIASAGFGKTTAVVQWAGQKDFPVAWFSLDRSDNDPVRFWTYLTAALRSMQPDIGEEVASMLRSSTNPPWEAAVSLLIDELAHLPFDSALVLDDYHLISEPIVHETLSFLVSYAPENFHLIIAGRTEPPLYLSRLRASGQVAELTARDLGFAAGEVEEFYKQRNIDLTGEEVEKLAHRIGGWAAGMQMAAMSLLESDNRAAAIERFGGRDRLLAGYFLEEVFGGVEPDVQEFLLQTSILSHLSGPLCEAVTGRMDSSAILATVGKACGFVACLDSEWYVYHHLFAEFLQALLKERYPERIGSLYSKAARWCEEKNLTASAIDYSLQGEEYNQAAVLVERLALEMLNSGETAILFGWLRTLPSEAVSDSPILCVAQAWAEAAEDRTAEVKHWLERAENSCSEARVSLSGGGWNRMAVDMAVLKAYLAIKRRDVPGVLVWLAQADRSPEKDFTYGRSFVLQPMGTSLLGGPLGWYGRLKEKAQAMENGAYLAFRGLAKPTDRAGYALVANAEALYEWNKIDAALKSLAEGMEEAQRAQEAGSLLPALFTLAKIHWSRGDLTAALAVAEEAERKVRSLNRQHWLFSIAALKARLNMAADEKEAVGAWLKHNRLDIYDRLSAVRAYEHITYARVLLVRGQAEKTLLLLERLLVFAEKEQWLPQTIEVSNLLAIAYDAAGRTGEGLKILRRNLALGRENGYLRSFVDEGAPMLAILRRLAHSRPVEDEAYLRQLLGLLRESPVLRYPGLQAVFTGCESLTAKELAVLRLMDTGLDRRSIAGELGVALPTVKTHLANIYGKLGATGRREAVERARRLGILK